MDIIKQKNGWMKVTRGNTQECGLCDNILLAGRTTIAVEFPPEKKGRDVERYLIEICDGCRRHVCTCDLCAAFNRELVEPSGDDDEDSSTTPEPGDEPEFECFCQMKPEMEETSEEDWCLEWKQARIITEAELNWRLEGRPETEDEDDNDEQDEDEDEDEE